jgi:hypothetical protein
MITAVPPWLGNLHISAGCSPVAQAVAGQVNDRLLPGATGE